MIDQPDRANSPEEWQPVTWSEAFRFPEAFRRALEGGRRYLKSWAIALSAIALSVVGVVGLGVGYQYTSVWAWSVVGYAFSRALVLPTPAQNGEQRS